MPEQNLEPTTPEPAKKTKTKSKKKMWIIIILAAVLLVGGSFLAYQFLFIPGQVTSYRNETVSIHNSMVATVDEMNVITDQINEGSTDPTILDNYVTLADKFVLLISDLEAIDQYSRNNEALKDFNQGVDDLITSAKETEKVERDIAVLMREMVLFSQCGEDVVAATEIANPAEVSTFEKAFADYDIGLKKCDDAIHNLNSAVISPEAEQAKTETVDYFTSIKKAYDEMKTALGKSETAIKQNNYNMSIDAVSDIEEIGERLENTSWPTALENLLSLEEQAVTSLNESFDAFGEYDDALIKEWGIESE